MTRARLPLWLACLFATLALRSWTDTLAPRAGEPLPLRWARTTASHPLRSALGLWLVLAGLDLLRTARNTQDLPKRPGSAREEAPFELG